MKKLIYLLITVLVLFPALAYAESQVEVKSIDLIEKSVNTVIVEDASTDGDKVNLNIEFYDKDDYALYKIVVKNTTSSSLYINDKSFNQGNENIVYEFIFSDNNIVKSGEEKTFNLKVSYTKEVERSMFRSGRYDASLNEPLVLSDKIIGVPDTMKNLGILGLFLLVIVIACLFIGINSIFKIKYGSYFSAIILILLLLIIPNYVDALLKIDIPFDSKITIKMVKPKNCVYNGELVQGAEYIDGQYTYHYMQNYYGYGSRWSNMNIDGWGVTLTDKDSTEPITSKLCTYINDKPITDLRYVLYGSNAESVDLSSWDVSNVTSMNYAFASTKIKEFDLRGFDTSNLTDISSLFANSRNLSRVDAPNLDLSNVTNMSYMFTSSLSDNGDVYIDMDNWYFPKVTSLETLFHSDFGSSSSVTLHVNNWDVSKIADGTKFFYMFALQTRGDVTVEAKNWNFNGATKIYDAFRLVGPKAKDVTIDVTGWDTSTITNLDYAFEFLANEATGKLTITGLDTWDTSKVTSMVETFFYIGYYCDSVKMDVSKWDVSKVTSMYKMFSQMCSACNSLDIGDLSSWNLESANNFESFIYYLGSNNYNDAVYDIGTLNIKNESNIKNIFNEAKGIKVTLNLYKKPTFNSYMFSRTAIVPGSGVTINYTNEVDNIDELIATKGSESNIIKGELIS